MYRYLIGRKDGNIILRRDETGYERLVFQPISWQKETDVPERLEELSEQELNQILQAFQLAERVHANQKDKAGKPYINHPLRVSQLVEGGGEEITAALLHDVVEDTPITLKDLEEMGFSQRVVHAVDCVTQRRHEPRQDYLCRVKSDETAVRVKLADLAHNADLSRLVSPQKKDIERAEKYKKEAEFLNRE